jgi:hypothetical protein
MVSICRFKVQLSVCPLQTKTLLEMIYNSPQIVDDWRAKDVIGDPP